MEADAFKAYLAALGRCETRLGNMVIKFIETTMIELDKLRPFWDAVPDEEKGMLVTPFPRTKTSPGDAQQKG